MALQALGPATRPGLGFLPVAAIPEVVTGAQSLISGVENLFGGASRFASSAYEGAEASRANTYLMGVALGSVQAGQLLLGQNQSDTSAYAQSYTKQILASAQSNYPTVMQQASQAGALHDSADGYQGLLILSQAGVHYANPYAGYSTNTGSAPTGATATLVTQLAALPANGTTTIPGTSVTTSKPATGISTASMPMLIGAGILVAVFVATRPKGRRA